MRGKKAKQLRRMARLLAMDEPPKRRLIARFFSKIRHPELTLRRFIRSALNPRSSYVSSTTKRNFKWSVKRLTQLLKKDMRHNG